MIMRESGLVTGRKLAWTENFFFSMHELRLMGLTRNCSDTKKGDYLVIESESN